MTSKMKGYRESLARFNDPKALGELAVAPTSEARRIAVQDPIEALRAVAGSAIVEVRDDLDTDPNRDAMARDRLALVAPELLAVVRAIRLDHDQSIGPEEQSEGVKAWWKLPATKAALDALVAKIREVLR